MSYSDFPLVSIVTPSYNQGQFIEQTLLSVFQQDYPNIEYIVIDGGSKDNTVQLLKKYDKKITYWLSEKDKGQTDAIIKGFARAKGKYWTWLCSDDILEPSAISISVYFLEKTNCGLSFGNRTRIDHKGNIFAFERASQFHSWHLKMGLTLPQETVLFRKDAYLQAGGLDESLQMVMDFDLWCKMSRVTDFFYIPTFLGRFRSHSSNKSTLFSNQLQISGFNDKYTSEFAMIFRKYFSTSPSTFKMKLGNFLRQFCGFLERRSGYYKRNLLVTRELRYLD